MVAYITAYPLDEEEAADVLISNILDVRKEQRRAYVNEKPIDDVPFISNLSGKVKTALHQSPCKNWRYVKLDVDTKEEARLEQLYKALAGATIVTAVETRGGYHVVLEKGPWCQAFYQAVQQINGRLSKEDQWIMIENSSGPMLAIPGTRQGGFVVKDRTAIWRTSVGVVRDD